MLHTKLTLARAAAAMVAANMSRRTFHMTAMAAGGHMPHESLEDGNAIAAGREYVGYFLNGEPVSLQ